MDIELITRLISEIDFDSVSEKSSEKNSNINSDQETLRKILKGQIYKDVLFKKLKIFETKHETIYFGDIIKSCNFAKLVFTDLLRVENENCLCAATFVLPFSTHEAEIAGKNEFAIPIFEIFVNILFYAWFYYFEPHELFTKNILEFQFAIVKEINVAINIMIQNGLYVNSEKFKSKLVVKAAKKSKSKELKPFFTNVIDFKSKHWPVFFDQYLKVPEKCDSTTLKSQIILWNENVTTIRKYLPLIQKQSLIEISNQRDQTEKEYTKLQSQGKNNTTSSMFE